MSNNQLFGTIQTVEGEATAMACVDVDRPSELMLQWWGEGITPAGVLCLGSVDGATVTLKPHLVYRVENGSMFLPQQLSPEEVQFKQAATATLRVQDNLLVGEWIAADGTRRAMQFQPLPKNGGIEAQVLGSWPAFRSWADTKRVDGSAGYFRGHGCSSFSLMTSMHRAGRFRIERYRFDELARFKVHVEMHLEKRFNFNDPQDHATIIALAQHYGVPTPLLDWTLSPYVAAFFAFSDALEHAAERRNSTHVRIYALSKNFVTEASPPIVQLGSPKAFVSALDVDPIHNPRLYAQQGKFLVTNVAALESYICALQRSRGVVYLEAVDIPLHCAKDAMQDLEFMGLTAATMYHGLDGIGRMFQHSILTASNALRMTTNANPESSPQSQEGTPDVPPSAESSQPVLP
jgi:hypothetical protein